MILSKIPNLRAHEAKLVQVTRPPQFRLPPFDSKQDYRNWCRNPRTQHAFISGVEGSSPEVRVSATNEPHLIHTLIAEYDAPATQEGIDGLAGKNNAPNWFCKSFSGHGRLFWELEKPILYPGKDVWEKVTEIFWKRLKAHHLLPGFSLEESSNIAQYYEIGHDWKHIVDGPLDQNVVVGWMTEAYKLVDWSREGQGLPEEVVRDLCAEAYPDGWPGGWENFRFGGRGTRFWDGGDAESVIAYETGCVCFTGDKPFVSWSEILGAEAVQDASAAVTGKAIKDIYLDISAGGGRRWWSNHSDQGWALYDREQILNLLAGRGLSRSRAKVLQSEAEIAMGQIERTQTITSAIARFYDDRDILIIDGKRYMNLSKVKLMQPHPNPNPRGENFPKLLGILDAIFGEQLPWWLAYIRHFYHGALKGELERGLGCVVAGPVNVGKSFLNNAVWGKIFGRGGLAGPFLVNGEAFTGRLMTEHALLFIDDGVREVTHNHRNFGERIKSIIANTFVTVRFMHRDGYEMEWLGRLLINMNDDPESLTLFPDLDISIRDKLMIFQAFPHKLVPPSDAVLARELPYFCAFLRDSKHDKCVETEPRFGIKPYHNPHLVAEVEAGSEKYTFAEALDIWRKHWFHTVPAGKKREYWEGNSTELMAEMSSCPALGMVHGILPRSPDVLGRKLTLLLTTHKWITRRMVRGYRVYRIYRDDLREENNTHEN